MGVEQHLVGLQQVGPEQERPAVRQIDVGDLKLRCLPADRRPVLAPVELEGLAGLDHERHEGAASGGLLLALAIGFPLPRKGRDPSVGALVAEGDKSSVELLEGPPLLARPARLRLQLGRQPVSEGIELARPFRSPEHRFHRPSPRLLADRVPRQPRPPHNLPNGKPVPQSPPSDHAQ